MSLLTTLPSNLFEHKAEVLAPKVFCQKIHKPLKQFHVYIHHILFFQANFKNLDKLYQVERKFLIFCFILLYPFGTLFLKQVHHD